MDKKQKANSARKPGIFGSLSGFFCSCGDEERSMTNDKEYQMKSRALSSDITTSTASELYREIEEELLVKRDPYEYKPCLITKPNYWHPVSELEISHEKKNVNIYGWGRYHAFLGQGKYIGQRPIGLLEPSLDMKSEEPVKVSLRFNKFSKVSGFGLSFSSSAENINHNLGIVTKRRNQWIQENMLNPENESNNHNKMNSLQMSFGGIYFLHEAGQEKSTMISTDRLDQVPISWKEKDHIILEYTPQKSNLKISVVNYLNFETKSYSFQIDLESVLRQEDKEQDQFLHFSFVLDQVGDHVEVLGEPDANLIKQKAPPLLKNIQFYDLSQKYYLDQSCCSTRVLFENKTMDCVLIYSDNHFLNSGSDDEFNNCYMFAYFKPCIPFPNEKIYIKRIAFMIESVGDGELFLGITREAYAIHNIDVETTKPEEEWQGRKMLFRSSGKGNVANTNQIQKFNNSFTSGSLVIVEYNPFTDSVSMINQNNVQSVINNVYADFTDKEFQDKQNRYCFCIGGASNFRVCLYNDYFDDIEDTLRQ